MAQAQQTCPQCGSLVPAGARKCGNCGARLKDFAPAPSSYVAAVPPTVARHGSLPAHAVTAPVNGDGTPARAGRSRAAGRSLRFSLLPVLIDVGVWVILFVVVGSGLTRGDDGSMVAVGLGIAALSLLGGAAMLVLLILSLMNGVRGLRETKDGELLGRARAIAGLVISTVVSVLWIASLVGFASLMGVS